MRRYLTIGEVGNLLHLNTSQIRFYEKKGLVKPYKVEDNKYRLYSFREIERLENITVLRSLDLSIEEIRDILSLEMGYDISEVGRLIKNKVKHQMKRLNQILKNVEDIEQLYEELQKTEAKVEEIEERIIYVADDDVSESKTERDVYDFVMYHQLDYVNYMYELYNIIGLEKQIMCIYSSEVDEEVKALQSYILPKGRYYCKNFEVEDFNMVKSKVEKIRLECIELGYEVEEISIVIENLYAFSMINEKFMLRVEIPIR